MTSGGSQTDNRSRRLRAMTLKGRCDRCKPHSGCNNDRFGRSVRKSKLTK